MNALSPRSLLSPRGVLLVVILGGLLFSSVYPLRSTLAVRGRIADLELEERALQERMDALRAEADALRSDAEVERIAREELGMVRPGENAFVIASPPPVAPEPAPVDPGGFAPAPNVEEDPLLLRWWSAVRRAAGAR